MLDGVEKIIIFSQEALNQYGYVAIFILLLLESFLFTGAFIPGIFVLVVAGYISQQGILHPSLVLAVSTIAILSGDGISYFLGKKYGHRIISFPSKIYCSANQNWWFLIFYHHIPLSRMFIPAFYGMNQTMTFPQWLRLDIISTLLFVVTYYCIGYYASYYSNEISDVYNRYNIYIMLLGVSLLVFWFFRVLGKK